jgi:hypothetical protein
LPLGPYRFPQRSYSNSEGIHPNDAGVISAAILRGP